MYHYYTAAGEKTQAGETVPGENQGAVPLWDKKYPRWVQEAEWPIVPSGKPMRFLEQKKAKGKAYAETMLTHYVFEDVDTGEQRVIDQFT